MEVNRPQKVDIEMGEDEATVVAPIEMVKSRSKRKQAEGGAADFERDPSQYVNEKTVVLSKGDSPKGSVPPLVQSLNNSKREWIKKAVAVLAVLMVVYEVLYGDGSSEQNGPRAKVELIRPKLPDPLEGAADPAKSQTFYQEGMKLYILDHVTGYRRAAEKFRQAANADPTNVRALALLASSYLNLIDISNKDESYFQVISKLIELSRAKAVDLAETVIADVEFYVTVNKPEAAQSRIVEYTRMRQGFGLEMFYYIAYAFYHRGDYASAARYLGQYPDNKAFSAKIFFLRGQIAEKLNDPQAALAEYRKALQMNREHAKSHLALAALLRQQGTLKDAAQSLEFLAQNPTLLVPRDLAQAYFLHALLYELYQKWDVALGDMDRAIALEKENHDFLLEYYLLKTKTGGTLSGIRREARMYFFLGEGERLLKEGKSQEALGRFLEARQQDQGSPLPLVKIGDMFARLNDLSNARLNYKMAAERAPRDIEIWSKYMNVLIQSFEWEEAEKVMAKFRTMNVSQSAIDKAAGDMYAKQGRHVEAQMFYKKAMSRDSIDSSVYIAYGKSLLAVKNYKDAPFFFALALRFDPLNAEAVIGTAKAVAGAESIDRGIALLQDELQKGNAARAELLSAIAEMQIQKGDWELAKQNVDQAMAANPDYAYPWKLQAQLYLNREGVERKALDNALDSFKSYSDRNPSDPSGYFERYRIFTKKTEFEKASEELNRVYALYPKYPNLHYYKGALFSLMGNRKVAKEEYQAELRNNPGSVTTLIALGKEHLETNDPRAALESFNQAMRYAPKAGEPLHMAGYANFLLKNYAAAVALYQQALVYDSGNALIYKRLGTAFKEMGDGANARAMFKKYLEAEPDAPDRAQFQNLTD